MWHNKIGYHGWEIAIFIRDANNYYGVTRFAF